MLNVYDIEADDGCEKADVCFGDVGAVVEGARGGGEVFFGAVEGFEEGCDGFFVGFLRAVVG